VIYFESRLIINRNRLLVFSPYIQSMIQ